MEKLTCFFKESEGMLICATGLVAKASIRHHRLVEYEVCIYQVFAVIYAAMRSIFKLFI